MKQETPPASAAKARRRSAGVVTDSPSPLDILLTVMRRRWDAEDEDGAVKIALAAAPFLHPRRARPGADGGAELLPDQMTDAELARLIADTRAGTSNTAGDPQLPDGLGPSGAE